MKFEFSITTVELYLCRLFILGYIILTIVFLPFRSWSSICSVIFPLIYLYIYCFNILKLNKQFHNITKKNRKDIKKHQWNIKNIDIILILLIFIFFKEWWNVYLLIKYLSLISYIDIFIISIFQSKLIFSHIDLMCENAFSVFKILFLFFIFEKVQDKSYKARWKVIFLWVLVRFEVAKTAVSFFFFFITILYIVYFLSFFIFFFLSLLIKTYIYIFDRSSFHVLKQTEI